MNYWYTVYRTNSLAFIKYVRAGVLIDSSFCLCHRNDINNWEDLIVVAARLEVPESEAADCRLNG